ncbi:MAG: Protein FdhD [Candidatus Argoarchaeum ethanivorans]|uniref:Protein FdhD n=1 Tax=Candidatus Argoarchaeum ethanivorans TaxID=2608793 RepID=A0A811TII7_9EURY|nr:MAG: Protein FdhD [Candidatus Argoarchaeum ethanivorans]
MIKSYAKTYKALAVKNSSIEEVEVSVACEKAVELFVNNKHLVSILATPNLLEELALGFLVCEGVVNSPEDIISIDIEDSRIMAMIKEQGKPASSHQDMHIVCDTIFERQVILDSVNCLESEAYYSTRGTHAACIVNKQGECKKRLADVRRHNAIDKVVGYALHEHLDLCTHFLLSTGRQSASMVLKAVRAGIPLIVTNTAPFNSGIDAADQYNICLVCFAEPDYMLITTHPERIKI